LLRCAGVNPTAAVNMLADSLFPIPIFRNYGKSLAEKKSVLTASKIPTKDLGLFNRLAEVHARSNPITQTLLQLTLGVDR
jgi:3-hydroxyisobutyrate dehydrogenase-like beta-hydroxyacid dehydrogenase